MAGGDFERAAGQLGAALALWRGDVCADVTLGPDLDVARSGLDERRLAVIEDCLEARLQRGEHRELVPELRGLVAAHPLRERLWEYLMLALSSAGRPADGLAAYAACREAFVRELGLEPGPRLRDLQTAILANDAHGPVRPERLLPTAVSESSWSDVAAPDPAPASPLSISRGPLRQPPIMDSQPASPTLPAPQPPAPQHRSPLRSRPWRAWHSLWLLPALLGFGFWTWLSFLYIGIRARRKNWLLMAAAYAVLLAAAVSLTEVTHPSWVATLGFTWVLAIWGAGSVHAVLENRSWLRWRSDRTPWYLS
jgi:hypothetical protein